MPDPADALRAPVRSARPTPSQPHAPTSPRPAAVHTPAEAAPPVRPPHGLAAAALVPLLDERERVLRALAATRPDVRAELADALAFFDWLRHLGKAYAVWRMSASGRADLPTADMPPASEVIGTAEAARLLGCTPRHVRRLAEAGALAGRRTGAGWLLDRGSVEVAGGGGPHAGVVAQAV